MRHLLASLAAMACLIADPAHAAGIDLSQYRLSATYDLPGVKASEASAVTWNWDTGTLFVIGDEGEYVVEVDKQGRELSSMRLLGFDDTEGLTYVGNGQFVIVEERLQTLYRFSYQGGGLLGRGTLPSAAIGPVTGNTGLEGASFDPVSGDFVIVKEKVPQALYQATVNFGNGSATVHNLVPPANPFAQILGTQDLADVQVLNTVPALAGTEAGSHLLVLSQETPLLMSVTRQGQVLSRFDLAGIAGDIEGVTIDGQGTIYLVGETPRLYVLTAVPEPGTWALLIAGIGVVAWSRRGAIDRA